MSSTREPLCKIPRQYWGSFNQRARLEEIIKRYDYEHKCLGTLLDDLLKELAVGNCNDFQFTRIMAQIRGYPVV